MKNSARSQSVAKTDDSNKHDYHFVLQVWVYLFLHLQLNSFFDRIDIWTDGGPHHFKARYCQFMWHALSTLRFDKKPITHNFFASYHGHSFADGHAAVVKRTPLSELQRTTALPGATWGPSNVNEIAELIRGSCQNTWGPSNVNEVADLIRENGENTEVVVFNQIDRDDKDKPQVKRVPEIKTLHSLTHKDGECFGKVRTDYPGIKPFAFY
jgi:hypothetical protein